MMSRHLYVGASKGSRHMGHVGVSGHVIFQRSRHLRWNSWPQSSFRVALWPPILARQTEHCDPLCCQHLSLPSCKIVLQGSPERVGAEHRLTGSAINVLLYYFLAGPTRPSHFSLERPDGVTILFAHILFYMFSKDHDWVVILFHSARRALDRGFEPGCNTFVVKYVFAF